MDKLLELMEEHRFGKLVAHAPYTMNLCAAKENVRSFSIEMFQDDMKRMEYVPGNYYNFHPGSHVGQGAEKGIELIAEALNESLFPEQKTTVLLETPNDDDGYRREIALLRKLWGETPAQ